MHTRSSLDELKTHFVQPGCIEWLGVRPARGEPMIESKRVQLVTGRGIEGDRAGARPDGKRQVTLIQAETLPLLQQWTQLPQLCWSDLRRNIVVSGINLSALMNTRIEVGEAVLQVTGFCHPCSKLEQQLGYGVFNTLRGFGGLTARVEQGGVIQTGDRLQFIELIANKN